MTWISINGNLIQAQGKGSTYSVRKLDTTHEYLVKRTSFTNGESRAIVKSQGEGINLAEKWNNER